MKQTRVVVENYAGRVELACNDPYAELTEQCVRAANMLPEGAPTRLCWLEAAALADDTRDGGAAGLAETLRAALQVWDGAHGFHSAISLEIDVARLVPSITDEQHSVRELDKTLALVSCLTTVAANAACKVTLLNLPPDLDTEQTGEHP